MWRMFLFLLIFISSANGQHLIPGSYRIEYGGIYKLISGEANRFYESTWRDQERQRYLEGEINFLEFIRRQNKITEFVRDYSNGEPWHKRRWWESFPPEKGGAPLNGSIVLTYGRTDNLINTPIFTFNNAMELRWKKFEVAIDLEKEQSITLGRQLESPKTGWKLDFSPIFDFSPGRLFSRPAEAINRIGFSIGGVHTVNTERIATVDLQVWHSLADNETRVGIFLAIARW